MYYGIIVIAVIMFGGCFAIQDVYRRVRGASGLKMSFESALTGSLGGILVLSLVNCISFDGGFHFDPAGLNPGFTPFTLVMASLAAINSLCFTYCAFQALGSINLSVFSLFSMLGGMILPFIQGILFYNERITLAKIICVVFILASLTVTLELKGDGKKNTAYLYYLGIFVLNGMAGVLSKIFSSSTLPKTSNAGYTLWIVIVNAVISGTLLFCIPWKKKAEEPPFTPKMALIGGSYGAINKIANFLLVLSLSQGVDASAQFPLVTGGVIIVSTLSSYLTDRKPSRKELLSVVLAFFGTLALFLVPEINI